MRKITLRDGRFDDEISEGSRIYRQVDEVLNTYQGGTIGPVKVTETTVRDRQMPEVVKQISKHAKVHLDGGAETGIHQFTYLDAQDNPVVHNPEALAHSRWFRGCLPDREGAFEANLLEFDAVYVTLTVRVPYDTAFGIQGQEAQVEVAKEEVTAAVRQTNAVVVKAYAKASLENRVHVLATDGEVLAMDVPAAEAMLYGGNGYHVVPASTPIHKAIYAIVTR